MKRFLMTVLMAVFLMTACGTEKDGSGLKTGPTVTPMPPKATEEDATIEFDFTAEEIETTINLAIAEYKKHDVEYSFEISDEMTSEITKHDDGYSEVYVYDKDDLMLAVLMYDETKHLYRAELTEYKNGVVVCGTTYEEGILSAMYVTEAGNNSFRVEIKSNDKGYETSYVDKQGVKTIQYNKEFEKIG